MVAGRAVRVKRRIFAPVTGPRRSVTGFASATGRAPEPEWCAPRLSRSGTLLDQADSPAQTTAEQSTATPAVVLGALASGLGSGSGAPPRTKGRRGRRRWWVMTVAVATRATRKAAVTGETG
nr:hypothetical protein GCM10020093_000080 [Planobispora longispora]